jgi:hypothetical protein
MKYIYRFMGLGENELKKKRIEKPYEPFFMALVILLALPINLYFHSRPNVNISEATGNSKLTGLALIIVLYALFEGSYRLIRVIRNRKGNSLSIKRIQRKARR